jgi:hypothetical protein
MLHLDEASNPSPPLDVLDLPNQEKSQGDRWSAKKNAEQCHRQGQRVALVM